MQPDTLRSLRQQLQSGTTTLPQILGGYLDRAAATRDLNIYVELYEEEARDRAEFLQQKFEETPETVGRLFGAVLSIKDNICHADHGVTGGSKILENYSSPFSATAVERLLAEDAIIIGRTNCDEFGMGSSTEKSVYGATKNPLDPTRVPGGSSGGAAASVAAGTCLAAIGTDTGGSVRQPAAFCNLVGLKPTYGRISRWGLLAYGSSFDQVGTLTHTVEDAALLLEIMAGADAFDATVSYEPVPPAQTPKATGPKRIALLAGTFETERTDPAIQAANDRYLSDLRAAGHHIETVPFDLLDYLVPTYYVLTTAEASSNLSRYDGVRYGYRHPEAADIHELYRKTRTEGFGQEVKRRILLGTFVLSAGYYDAYYARAQRVRRLLRERLDAILTDHDLIVLPVSPVLPWPLGGMDTNDPTTMYLADIYTVLPSLTGHPALAIPIGDRTTPVGVQVIGRRFGEAELLGFCVTTSDKVEL